MPIQFRQSNNIVAVTREWRKLAREYPKAVSKGINRAAFTIAIEDNPEIIDRAFDRPVAFTKKSAYYTRSTPNRLRAFVGIKDIQAEYLEPQVFGTRGRAGKAVPVKIRLNKFGNIASLRDGKKVSQLIQRPDTFMKNIGGVSGVWRRRANRLDLLILFSPQPYRYRKRLDWFGEIRRAADRRLPQKINESINRALVRLVA